MMEYKLECGKFDCGEFHTIKIGELGDRCSACADELRLIGDNENMQRAAIAQAKAMERIAAAMEKLTGAITSDGGQLHVLADCRDARI